MQAEPVCEARQIVEQSHDVSDFETPLVVEAKGTEFVPVALDHSRGRCAELVCDLAQRALEGREGLQFAPPMLLDRLRQLRVAVLRTEELCM